MSKLMKHRTDNDIKNKWYSMMRKEKKTLDEQQKKNHLSSESTSIKSMAARKSEKGPGEQQKYFEPMDENLDHDLLASDGIAQLVAADTLYMGSSNADLTQGALQWSHPSNEKDSWVASFGRDLPAYYDPRQTGNHGPRPGIEDVPADCAMQDIGSGNKGHVTTLASAQSHPYPVDASILYISDDTMPPLYIMPPSNTDAQALTGGNDLYLEGHGVHANSANNCHAVEANNFWGGRFNSGNAYMPVRRRSESCNPSLKGPTRCGSSNVSCKVVGDTIKTEYAREPDPTHSNGKVAIMHSKVPEVCSSTAKTSTKSDENDEVMPNICSSTPGTANVDNYSYV